MEMLFQVLVSKVQVLLPIKGRHVVFARTNVVTNPSVDGFVDWWLFRGPEGMAEQLVDGFRSKSG